MEGAQGLRYRQDDSDQGPLHPESYGNEGFVDEHDIGNRAKKKQMKSSKRKFEADFRLRNVPKTAWNEAGVSTGGRDQVEGNGVEVEDHSGLEGCGWTVECETSFDRRPFVPQETDDLESMVVGLERNIDLVIDSISEVARTRDRARQLASMARLEVERRKEALVEAIEDFSRRLTESVDGQLLSVEAESEESTERLKETLTSMKRSFEMTSQLTSMKRSVEMTSHLTDQGLREFRQQLLKWLNAWNESKAPLKSPLPVDLSSSEQPPIDFATLHRLFGISMNDDTEGDDVDIETSDAIAPTKNANRNKHAATLKLKYSLGGSQGTRSGLWSPQWRPRVDGKNLADTSKRQQLPDATLRIQNRIRDCPQLVLTFSSRLKKDKRTCGITDLALTDAGQILVLDRNNKAVKMFDSQGTLLKYFGKSDLRKPSRISCIRSRGQIAVTDEGSNRVLVFSEDGQFLSQLIALQRPISHCQLTASRLAILEFSTRSVVICDLAGKIVSTFPTHLECPSYIACTKSERIIITDWKSESFKIFDSIGSEKFSYCHGTSAESARHVVEPYGACADNDDGVLIVADRKKRQVVFYSEEGAEVWSYDDAANQIGVPFAVDCNGSGILAIGEYTGTIRLFKYKTCDEGTADATPCNDRIYAAPAEEHV